MVYNFPYTILRKDLKELEVGFFVKVANQMAVIVSKNPFPYRKSVSVAASSTLTIDFSNTDSSTTATSGTMSLKGFVGETKKRPPTIVQIKYLAFGTSQAVTIKWGKDAFPVYADVTFSSVLNPPGLIQTGNVGASPLAFNRFSYEPSMALQLKLDNGSGAVAVLQDIFMDCIEYEYDIVQLTPRRYDMVNSKGYLQHFEE